MSEKRKYTRINLEMPVKCKILGRQKKKEISYEISSRIRNISEGGVTLDWPKSWNCKVCSNCLVWIFNYSCGLKNESLSEEQNRHLTPSIFVQIEFASLLVPHPVKVTAKVVWADASNQKNSYPIGVAFLEDKKGNLDMLREKISILKEKESSL